MYPSWPHLCDELRSSEPANSVVGNGTTTYVNLATLSNSANFAPHGGVLSMTLGNGLVQSQTFNSLLQPTQIQAGSLLTLGLGFRDGLEQWQPPEPEHHAARRERFADVRLRCREPAFLGHADRHNGLVAEL